MRSVNRSRLMLAASSASNLSFSHSACSAAALEDAAASRPLLNSSRSSRLQDEASSDCSPGPTTMNRYACVSLPGAQAHVAVACLGAVS